MDIKKGNIVKVKDMCIFGDNGLQQLSGQIVTVHLLSYGLKKIIPEEIPVVIPFDQLEMLNNTELSTYLINKDKEKILGEREKDGS